MFVCPFCKRDVVKKVMLDRHYLLCPYKAENWTIYRALLEDPQAPGVLIKARDYEKKREDLFSECTLRNIFCGSWAKVGVFFSLESKLNERKTNKMLNDEINQLGVLIDLEIAHNTNAANEAKLKENEAGLQVLRYETRRIGDVYQRTYIIR